uniref:Photolyase/cryptochrome alpha/beta domain-containing protein n=1 Tax=Glossina brevipalpis TaxID=37001 RepID=A0A1A9WM15_9MUSC
MSEKRSLVHWFRKGLRLHDNPGLTYIFDEAQVHSCYNVRPIYILDPAVTEWTKIGANRSRFLQESLEDLHNQLKALNSRLYVIRGSPSVVFSRLFKEWRVEVLTFEENIEPYAIKYDTIVKELAKMHNVTVKSYHSHTIYDAHLVIQNNHGKAPLTYQKFIEITEILEQSKPLGKPKGLTNLNEPEKDSCEKEDINCYMFPNLEELVKCKEELGANIFRGGEMQAIKRLNEVLANEKWVMEFEKPGTKPNSLEPSTTVLSPYLSFGCLSSRYFCQRLKDILKRHPNHTKPPVSLMGQLMWREFFYTAATYEPNFDRMMGNSLCLQIPWRSNAAHLEAWSFGRTGYPFIDAIMRQLRQEGWIHHLARHAVACFLTRGDLWISWEEGEKVFEELLLDQDWALNAGNWLWLSASAFFHKYFHVYSPVAFGKKTDRSGSYIRKYVPELLKYPDDKIYEPWKASLADQRKYGCVLGTHYPDRIVKHELAHKENIKRMTAAYKVNREVRTGKSEEDTVDVVRKRKTKYSSKHSAKKNKI